MLDFSPCDIWMGFASKNIFWAGASFSVNDIDHTTFARHSVTLPAGFDRMLSKRRCEYLAGRLCAIRALRDAGINSQVGRAKSGRPLWPDGYAGSISHTGNFAIACVVRSDTPCRVGIDMEIVMSEQMAQELAPLLLTEEDRRYIDFMPFNQLVTLVFSAKESLFKALHRDIGYVFGFDEAELVYLDDCSVKLRIKNDLSNRWVKGSIIEVSYKCVGSVIYSFVYCDVFGAGSGRCSYRNRIPFISRGNLMHIRT